MARDITPPKGTPPTNEQISTLKLIVSSLPAATDEDYETPPKIIATLSDDALASSIATAEFASRHSTNEGTRFALKMLVDRANLVGIKIPPDAMPILLDMWKAPLDALPDDIKVQAVRELTELRHFGQLWAVAQLRETPAVAVELNQRLRALRLLQHAQALREHRAKEAEERRLLDEDQEREAKARGITVPELRAWYADQALAKIKTVAASWTAQRPVLAPEQPGDTRPLHVEPTWTPVDAERIAKDTVELFSRAWIKNLVDRLKDAGMTLDQIRETARDIIAAEALKKAADPASAKQPLGPGKQPSSPEGADR